ncbi:MAG: HAD family phosphatase [Anaerococcus sp.]|uniref:HAD family hydrolase n=1 Tax=Anaerococcus sp. TaxID=1872515 RepID=UPI0025B8F175|nr:HAD family phosphatase [Anaerococcus sp.]MCI5971451.1 HAD family phosphatase [Anaerococcus sp.]MDD6918094.1 HAD family phosphatase [Peptoniphilaceae bacterium]MDY2927155.1 HAD family phosphatase [Anaerococcus sp.]
MYGLIFDIDGTILDSMHIWIKPLEDIFTKYGYDLNKIPKEKKGEIEALPFYDMCEFLSKNIARDMTKDEVIKYFEETIENAYANDLLPKNGAVDFLKDLKKKGYTLSVASSTDYKYLEKALKRIGVFDLFDFVATPDTTGYNKSKKEFREYSIRKHGKSPEDLILFDDALYAIKAAKNSGIKTVGIKDFPWNEKEWDYIKKEADYFVDEISSFDIENL